MRFGSEAEVGGATRARSVSPQVARLFGMGTPGETVRGGEHEPEHGPGRERAQRGQGEERERGRAGDRAAVGPWRWPRRRSLVLDVALAMASGVECLVEGAAFGQRAGVPPVVASALGLMAGSLLLVRRRWPAAVVLVAVAVTPAQVGVLLSVVGLYTLAASQVPRRITAVLGGMMAAGTMIVAFLGMHRDLRAGSYHSQPIALVSLYSVLVAVGATAPPVLLGLYVGARRRLVESLRERADGLERELGLLAEKAAERAERARMEERTRIAREMHDVVAHRVSLMVVHASVVRAMAPRDPQRAAEGAELIGDMGRQALQELRAMLGVLRTHGSGTPPPAPAASSPAPAVSLSGAEADGPGLPELDGLIEQSRTAGVPVDFTVEGERRSLASRVEATVYRVVQEALTNVHKHAPGAKTRVRLAYRDDEVAVLVQNGPCDGALDALRLPSGGNGLLGMRERVTGLGGGFAAGPTDDGGFRVSAMLPAAPPAV
jgi:signal transduction histidine kinase